MITRADKLAEIERMIATARNLLVLDLGPANNAEAEARIGVLEALVEDYRRLDAAPAREMPSLEKHCWRGSDMATDIRDALQSLLTLIGDPDDWQDSCACFEDPSRIKAAIADAYAALAAAASVRATDGPTPPAMALNYSCKACGAKPAWPEWVFCPRCGAPRQAITPLICQAAAPSPQPPAPAEGDDWCEIDEARDIARAALAGEPKA